MKKSILLFMMLALFFVVPRVTGQNQNVSTVCFKSSMHCAGCQNTIFELLRFEKGVKDLKVDHVSNTIKVVYNGRKTSSDSLAAVIVKKGYKAETITEKEYIELTTSVKKEANPGENQR